MLRKNWSSDPGDQIGHRGNPDLIDSARFQARIWIRVEMQPVDNPLTTRWQPVGNPLTMTRWPLWLALRGLAFALPLLLPPSNAYCECTPLSAN